MTALDRTLLPDERISFRTKKHRIIFLLPLIWILFSIYATLYMIASPILEKLVWVPWALAVLFLGYVGLEYTFSEFAVTNKRVMMREGFITKHTTELRLSAIAQVNISQGILGQLLSFGTVSINAFGIGDHFTLIARAPGFQKAVNLELDKIIR